MSEPWRMMTFDGIAVLRRASEAQAYELRIYRRPVHRFERVFRWLAQWPSMHWVWPSPYEYTSVRLTAAEVATLHRSTARILAPKKASVLS